MNRGERQLLESALGELEQGNADLCRAILRTLIGEKSWRDEELAAERHFKELAVEHVGWFSK